MDEANRIMNAQTARGADFTSGGLIRRARALIPLLVPLFVSAFRRANDLALAMESRGYHGGEGRTRMNPLVYQRRDHIAYGIIALYLVMIFLIWKYVEISLPFLP
jgi:energy-coupling factor transport system permease protein